MMRQLPGLCCLVWLLIIAASLPGLGGSPSTDGDFGPSSYEWGAYRPNLYFGIRARNGSSPLFGLAWGGPFDDIAHINTLRHDAEERDHVTK
jgi:Glycosyl hydrolase family 63 N-terminal domain